MINDSDVYREINKGFKTLSYDEFMELEDRKKGERYVELSSKDKYRVRVTDELKPITIGYCKLTKEQKAKGKKMIDDYISRNGKINN